MNRSESLGDRPEQEAHSAGLRHRMVARQIAARGVRDARVLAAMERVPRHHFVSGCSLEEAYEDHPLPIGCGQTISQPYIVALMVESLALEPGARVLEVGTGCGYQAAVLNAMGCEVYTIEIVPTLAERARELLDGNGCERVHFRCGDGSAGWPEAAPFQGIVVAAAPAVVPEPLFAQLDEGGRLVIPLGGAFQELWCYRRTASGFESEQLCEVRFVPMTGGVA